jgi:hypothetical protein
MMIAGDVGEKCPESGHWAPRRAPLSGDRRVVLAERRK